MRAKDTWKSVPPRVRTPPACIRGPLQIRARHAGGVRTQDGTDFRLSCGRASFGQLVRDFIGVEHLTQHLNHPARID